MPLFEGKMCPSRSQKSSLPRPLVTGDSRVMYAPHTPYFEQNARHLDLGGQKHLPSPSVSVSFQSHSAKEGGYHGPSNCSE